MCSIDEMVEPPPASNSVSLDLQEFLHALGIKDPEQRELEEQEKQRQGNDGLGLEKRYAYFTAYLAGLDDHDRAQHHLRHDRVHEQYTSSTVRFPRDIHEVSRNEQTKILTNKTAFHFAVRGEVDYSQIPMNLDARLARGNLQSASAMRMQTKKTFDRQLVKLGVIEKIKKPKSERTPDISDSGFTFKRSKTTRLPRSKRQETPT